MEEISDEGQTGYLIPLTDEEDMVLILAERLRCLFEDVVTRMQWGEASRRKVESMYTWERVVAKMAPILKGL